MAKPVLEENLLKEIFRAFTANEDADLPSTKLLAALAKATGLAESSVKRLYIEMYQEVHQTDDDPFVPPAGMMG